MKIVRITQSVCPHCLKTLPARIYEKDDEVFMQKTCPEHGTFDVYLWPDAEHYKWHATFDFPSTARTPQRAKEMGCPHDCGLCTWHEKACNIPIFSITNACNLKCPICFTYNRNDLEYFMPTAEFKKIINSMYKITACL